MLRFARFPLPSGLLLLLCLFLAEGVSAQTGPGRIVIDDFSQGVFGPIVERIDGNSENRQVRITQTGLDPAHVRGGSRRYALDLLHEGTDDPLKRPLHALEMSLAVAGGRLVHAANFNRPNENGYAAYATVSYLFEDDPIDLTVYKTWELTLENQGAAYTWLSVGMYTDAGWMEWDLFPEDLATGVLSRSFLLEVPPDYPWPLPTQLWGFWVTFSPGTSDTTGSAEAIDLFEIAMVAIPEPATAAGFAGIMALFLARFCRKRPQSFRRASASRARARASL